MKNAPLSVWLAISLLVSHSLFAAEFFVSPQGDDSSPGSKSKPFATLNRARHAAREARQANPGQAVTIVFREGTYFLSEPVVFEALDSGATADKPVRYQAERGAEVILSAGRTIQGWQSDPNRPGTWKARVDPNWRFNQLWVNNRRAIRARTPNYWQFSTLDNVTEEPVPSAPELVTHGFHTRREALSDLAGIESGALKDIEVLVFHKWDTTRERLESVDRASGVFTTRGGKMKPWNKMDRSSLFHLENYLAALDQPGEWFLSRDGWIYYKPRPGEDMRRALVVGPVIDQFLHFKGTPQEPSRWVQHVVFEGIKFRHAAFNFPDHGLPPAQAAMNVDATAILLDGARDIRFLNCAVEHTGATAFWFRQACRDSIVSTTRIFDVGSEGVRIGETQLVPEPVRTGGITITNCIIQSGGRMMPHAVGIWIGHSADNVLSHCDVGDFFYTAVSVGWRWGYAESGAKRNRVEYNHLHHLGYRILSDMGGVYTLGPSEGTVVRNNVIHDVYSTRYGGWGLYPDEGSTGILFENNLVYDVRDGCVHQHYGKSNVFRNNILAFSEEGQVAVTRSEPHLSFIFENNIVYWDEGQLLGYSGWKAGAQVQLQNNLYWRAGGKPFDFAGWTWDEWRAKGRDKGSMIADPLFVDPAKRDFRLRPGSPAERIGFKPFDIKQAGVQGSSAWKRLANSLSYPAPYVVPKPAPLRVSADFEGSNSPALAMASVQDEGKPGLVSLSKDAASGGKQSLRIRESAELQAGYNPHFYWDPHFTSGRAVMEFSIRLDEGADARMEWRSSGHPYKTGPNLHFRAGALSASGKKLVDLAPNAWTRVKLSVPLGQDGANWELEITGPNGTTQKFKGLTCDMGWKEARWVGFSSQGTPGSSFYLDDLRFESAGTAQATLNQNR